MKIGQEIRPIMDNKQIESKAVKSPSVFGDAVQNQKEKLHTDQLNKLLSDIEEQGKRLSQSQTVKDLQAYKKLVQRFVKEAVDFGMELKQNKSWNNQGRTRTLKTVKEVDEKLVDLTNTMLSQEGSSIQILGKVGEIKGLLINLYT